MFTTLLESRAARQRRTGSTVASALAHGAAVALIVAMTMPGSTYAKLAEPAVPVTFISLELRPRVEAQQLHDPATIHQAPSTQITHVIVPPINMPTSLPPFDIAAPPLSEERMRIGGPGLTPSGIGGSSLAVDPGSVMSEATVDVAPRLLAGAAEPRYPIALRASGITGQVIVRFVVDTLGRAEMNSLTTVEATHVLFANAVQEVLGRLRFTPGQVGGRQVRTMVQLPFSFALR